MALHVHDDTCLDEAGEVVCGLEEHIHADACYAMAEQRFEGADYAVTVRYCAAVLPEGAALNAEEIPADSEEYARLCADTLAAYGATAEDMKSKQSPPSAPSSAPLRVGLRQRRRTCP